MNIRCCIIENESIYIAPLIAQLQNWAAAYNHTISVDSFSSGNVLDTESIKNYDIIFLDIVLNNKEENGIAIANRIRSIGYEGDIVFLTNFKEYVFDGYPVRALDYLLKPAPQDKIDHCMNMVSERLSDDSFVYQVKGEYVKLPFHDIIYFSSSNHHTLAVTLQHTYTIPQTIRNVKNQMPPTFVQCHRTLIVNLQHIIRISGKELYLSNRDIVPISDTFLKHVQYAFLERIS